MLTNLYIIINWVAPVLLAIYIGWHIFNSQAYKKIRLTGSIPYRIFDILMRLILIAFTAVVSWILLAIIGVFSGAYRIGSTYGTPIFRPKLKL